MSSQSLRRLVSEAAYDKLPERVRRDVRNQQASSEQLISWVQLAIVLTFGVLYAVSPKTFDPQAMFAPVPWALGAYLVFTLARLTLTLRWTLPQWFAHASAIADIALLLGLIWSFHVQYVQPAAFYLKAPTLLYAFIFIALRALQFEVRFLVVTGLSASLGWLAMAWYAVASSTPQSPVTRDYVEYMTSNTVLIGAEFDKVISILMVTGVLAFAMSRSRALLVRSVVAGATAREISRFVPSEVVRQAQTSEDALAPGQGVVRESRPSSSHCSTSTSRWSASRWCDWAGSSSSSRVTRC
jgi:adenylate cyclase